MTLRCLTLLYAVRHRRRLLPSVPDEMNGETKSSPRGRGECSSSPSICGVVSPTVKNSSPRQTPIARVTSPRHSSAVLNSPSFEPAPTSRSGRTRDRAPVTARGGTNQSLNKGEKTRTSRSLPRVGRSLVSHTKPPSDGPQARRLPRSMSQSGYRLRLDGVN